MITGVIVLEIVVQMTCKQRHHMGSQSLIYVASDRNLHVPMFWKMTFVYSSWRFGLLFLWHISTASFNIQETCCCNQRQWRTYTILRSSFLLNLWCIVDISIRKKTI
jgi:hypothetical protein